MCLTKQGYDYQSGKRVIEPMVACSAHMPQSLWQRLQAAKAHFGIDGVVLIRDALDEFLLKLGF